MRAPRRDIRPESVPGEPRAVRWVVDTTGVEPGEVRHAPGTIGPLQQYGVLTRVVVAPGAVTTWLAEPHTWTDQGPRLRDALAAALDLDGWATSPSPGPS